MDKSKITNLTGEIITYSENLMKVGHIVDALRAAETIDNPTTRDTTVTALLDYLDRIGNSASSIWWRALGIRKELEDEAPTPSNTDTKTPEEELLDIEEVTADDLPFR